MLLLWILFVICLCHTFMFISCSLVVTCWKRADLLGLLCVMFPCIFCHFPIRCSGSGVVLDRFQIFVFFLTFLESVHENLWKVQQFSRPLNHVLLLGMLHPFQFIKSYSFSEIIARGACSSSTGCCSRCFWNCSLLHWHYLLSELKLIEAYVS